ncbi:hypothetical protein llap_22674 [Limosa lapponica baueri]|uniref:DUF4772 domain-containing protein n=1 Tax=Limosa lapponica baueri TaxID=1758121 RepID=A0A2I0SZS3_LIMLA|nr:hypothetical protein llap_22674 [Limosa lapponica baueri]
MASVLSRRLGKRSLLGTRVSAPSALAEGMLVATQIPGLQTDLGQASAHTALREDGSCVPSVEESSQAPRFPSPGCQQLCAGQQVPQAEIRLLREMSPVLAKSGSPEKRVRRPDTSPTI